MSLNDLENNMGYKFKEIKHLKKALTHSSYANESKNKLKSNERLEFLGDAVLGVIVSEYLFHKFPKMPEGDLTKIRSKLVCEKSLYSFSLKLDIGEYVKLSKGEKKSGGNKRTSILADTFEALIAAVYLDSDIEKTHDFIMQFILPEINKLQENNDFKDYKTLLQEIIQHNKNEKLEYKIINEKGPDHNKHFIVQVMINSNIISKGGGHTKKDAEQEAARKALELMGY